MLPSEVIRRDGWCQHEVQNSLGRKCLIGAMEAGIGTGSPWLAYRDAVNLHLGVTGGGLIDWNNAPERTVDEVLEVMDAVEVELGLKVPVPLFTREPVSV